MSLFDVVFRPLNKAGDQFIESRREDGHGSTDLNPTHVSLNIGDSQNNPIFIDWQGSQQVTVQGQVSVVTQGNNSLSVTGDWLTDDQLRATPVGVTGEVEIKNDAGSPITVEDDYAVGILLDDQTGANNVLTFTFPEPVVSFWVATVGLTGVAKVDHYGGTPSASRGIPVEAGGVLPIPEPTTEVQVFAPAGMVVTVWGQRR